MKRLMKAGNVCALLSAVVMCIHGNTPMLQASEPGAPPAQARPAPAKLSMDVVTNASGELRGAVVNADTAPSANAKVVLTMVSSKESQQATTDASGRFLFTNVRPGVYTLTVNGEKGQTQSLARVWTQQTAPPAATPVALVSLQGEQSDDVVRGLNGLLGGGEGGEGGLGMAGAALLIGAGVVGIVAIAGGFRGTSGSGGTASP